jgi:hypothetical protein
VMAPAGSGGKDDEDQLADGMSLISQTRRPVAGFESSIRLSEDRGGVPVTNDPSAGYTAHVRSLVVGVRPLACGTPLPIIARSFRLPRDRIAKIWRMLRRRRTSERGLGTVRQSRPQALR